MYADCLVVGWEQKLHRDEQSAEGVVVEVLKHLVLRVVVVEARLVVQKEGGWRRLVALVVARVRQTQWIVAAAVAAWRRQRAFLAVKKEWELRLQVVGSELQDGDAVEFVMLLLALVVTTLDFAAAAVGAAVELKQEATALGCCWWRQRVKQSAALDEQQAAVTELKRAKLVDQQQKKI